MVLICRPNHIRELGLGEPQGRTREVFYGSINSEMELGYIKMVLGVT